MFSLSNCHSQIKCVSMCDSPQTSFCLIWEITAHWLSGPTLILCSSELKTSAVIDLQLSKIKQFTVIYDSQVGSSASASVTVRLRDPAKKRSCLLTKH